MLVVPPPLAAKLDEGASWVREKGSQLGDGERELAGWPPGSKAV